MNMKTLLSKLARIDVDGQSAEHVANLAIQYAAEARGLLKQRDKEEYETVTRCKILDACAISRYAGNTHDAAESILKSANITRAEIRATIDDKADRKRLYALLG